MLSLHAYLKGMSMMGCACPTALLVIEPKEQVNERGSACRFLFLAGSAIGSRHDTKLA